MLVPDQRNERIPLPRIGVVKAARQSAFPDERGPREERTPTTHSIATIAVANSKTQGLRGNYRGNLKMIIAQKGIGLFHLKNLNIA